MGKFNDYLIGFFFGVMAYIVIGNIFMSFHDRKIDNKWKQKIVNEGYGKYITDDKGNATFKWIHEIEGRELRYVIDRQQSSETLDK